MHPLSLLLAARAPAAAHPTGHGTYGDRVDRLPTDGWSDPKGEFLAAVAAGPVFALLGAGGFGSGFAADTPPPAGTVVPGTLSYYMHEGGHGTVPGDWDVFLRFLTTHLATR